MAALYRQRSASVRRARMDSLRAELGSTHVSRGELLAAGWSQWQIRFLLGAPDLVRRGAHWWLRKRVARLPADRGGRIAMVSDLRCAMKVHFS